MAEITYEITLHVDDDAPALTESDIHAAIIAYNATHAITIIDSLDVIRAS